MLRKFIVALLIWASFILQSSVFPSLSFAGIVPNLLIILTSSFGFMRGEKEGMWIGFISGLLCDIFFSSSANCFVHINHLECIIPYFTRNCKFLAK